MTFSSLWQQVRMYTSDFILRRRARTGFAPVSVSAISLHYVYHILRDFERFFCYNEMNDFLFAGVIFYVS